MTSNHDPDSFNSERVNAVNCRYLNSEYPESLSMADSDPVDYSLTPMFSLKSGVPDSLLHLGFSDPDDRFNRRDQSLRWDSSPFYNDFLPINENSSSEFSLSIDNFQPVADSGAECSGMQSVLQQSSEQNSATKWCCSYSTCNKAFTKKSDLARHQDSIHEGSGYLCGDCEVEGKQPTRKAKRKDHLQTHLQLQHRREKKDCNDIKVCPFACRATNEILAFSSQINFETHIRQKHAVESLAVSSDGNGFSQCAVTGSSANSSVHSDWQNCTSAVSQLRDSSANNKRTREPEPPNAKRARFICPPQALPCQELLDSGAVVETGMWTLPNSSLKVQNIEPMVESTEETFMGNVKVFDIMMLFMLYSAKYTKIEKSLASTVGDSGEPKTPSFLYSISRRSIKLHGPINLIQAYKLELEHDLSKIWSSIRRAVLTAPSTGKLLDPEDHRYLTLRAQIGQRHNVHATPRIFAMRNTQDVQLLNFWIKRILPSLFIILDEAIGDEYSASLVREGTTEQSSNVFIRIESPAMPAQTTKEYILQNLDMKCDVSLAGIGIHVRFLRGALRLLTGKNSADPEDVEENRADDERQYLPYHARWWEHPGMGASIGLLCTEAGFATLTCYVEIDKEIFMLTVDHFIDESYRKLLPGMNDKLTLTSPALAKVKSMKQDLKPLHDSFLGQMKAEFVWEYGDDVTMLQLENLPPSITNVASRCSEIENWLVELEKSHDDFKVGSLSHRCGKNSTAALCKSSSTVAFDSALRPEEISHRLDWALFKVDRRMGVNHHRCRFDPEKGALDYYLDAERQHSPGDTIEETGVVEANADVSFEGQTSGRVSGVVNATLMGVKHGGHKTLEHHIIVNENQRKDASECRGDSGAPVVRDNQLLGSVWASVDQQPVFTPIGTIFNSIKESLKVTEVRLPAAQGNPSPKPCNPPPTMEASLSFGNETERPRKRQLQAHNVILPDVDEHARKKASALISSRVSETNSPLTVNGILKAFTSGFSTEDTPSSPVPSLTFSRSPSPEAGPALRSKFPIELSHVKIATDSPIIVGEDPDIIVGEDPEDTCETTSHRLGKTPDTLEMHHSAKPDACRI